MFFYNYSPPKTEREKEFDSLSFHIKRNIELEKICKELNLLFKDMYIEIGKDFKFAFTLNESKTLATNDLRCYTIVTNFRFTFEWISDLDNYYSIFHTFTEECLKYYKKELINDIIIKQVISYNLKEWVKNDEFRIK